MTPFFLPAIFQVQCKPGFHREENTSGSQTPSKVTFCPVMIAPAADNLVVVLVGRGYLSHPSNFIYILTELYFRMHAHSASLKCGKSSSHDRYSHTTSRTWKHELVFKASMDLCCNFPSPVSRDHMILIQ